MAALSRHQHILTQSFQGSGSVQYLRGDKHHAQ